MAPGSRYQADPEAYYTLIGMHQLLQRAVLKYQHSLQTAVICHLSSQWDNRGYLNESDCPKICTVNETVVQIENQL